MIKSTTKPTTKKGAASFYVVIFTTLLLGVITMSFIRIMLSEATKSTNDDLSKSAYDSALAGIEDAKIALMKYHQCLDKGYTAKQNGNECEKLIWQMQQGMNDGTCDVVSLALGRNSNEGEVVIKETSSSSENSEDMEQAYTCVKIAEDLPDYRSTLNGTNRVRIIPIRTSTSLDSIAGIKLDWFSSSNASAKNISKSEITSKSSSIYYAENTFPDLSTYDGEKKLPVVSFDFFQTDDSFTIGQLSVNNDANTGTDHAQLVFRPTSESGTSIISSSDVLNYSDKADNTAAPANCRNAADEFLCHTIIAFPKTFNGGSRNQDTMLLRVELPYGTDDVDFSITLCTKIEGDKCTGTTNFSGVQSQVDSTGRANDLYRRVEARVELVDTNFPYPEFAVQLDGDGEDTLTKNFWVTRNCWFAEDGETMTCDNTGDVSGDL